MAADTEIGRLVVRLVATTVELGPQLKKAEDMLKSFVSSIKTDLQKLAGVLGVGLGVQQFTSSLLAARENVAELSRVAEKIGVPVEMLSTLADAAEKAGVPLPSLAQGLKFLSRNMFEAAQGAGQARAVFEELGIEVKNADGTMRPTMDVLMDISKAFENANDGAGKTAIALKFFGRAGQEMVPFLNLGTDSIGEFIDAAKKAGLQIDSDLGRKARQLGVTFKEIHDAVKGFTYALMAELLPSATETSKKVLGVAESLNALRKHLADIGEVLRYVAAVAIPLLIVKLTAASLATGGIVWAIKEAAFVIQYFAVTTLGPMLMNPLTWVAVALGALAVAWVRLGKETRDAAREHEKFAASVRTMKMDALKETLRETELQLTLIAQKYQAMIAELESGPSWNPFSDMMKGKEADATKKKLDELRDRIKILQEAIGDIRKTKVELPPVTDEEAVKKFEERIRQIKTEMLALDNPVKAAYAALEDFVKTIIGASPMTDRLKAKIGELRAAFDNFFQKQQGQKLWDVWAQADLENFVAKNERAMTDMESRFADGLLATRTFFEERRRIIQENAEREIINIKVALPEPTADPVAYEAGMAKIRAIRNKALSDTQKANRDEVIQLRSNLQDQLSLRTLFADMKMRGTEGDLANLKAQQKTELAALDEKHLAELVKIQTSKDELIAVEGKYLSKKEALEYAQFLQQQERNKLTSQQRRDLLQLELQAASTSLGLVGDVLNQIYEAGGQKIKAYFYLSKGIAFAQAVIDTLAGANKAVGQMGIFGIPMSAIIMATGMARAGLIAAQTIKGMALGGPVRGPGTGTSDSILARLSAGEFVMTKKSVDYYGPERMEAIRRMIIPKDLFRGVLPVATPAFAFAGGGMVAGNADSHSGNFRDVIVHNTWVFSHPDIRGEIIKNMPLIEAGVARGFERAGIVRDASRRYR